MGRSRALSAEELAAVLARMPLAGFARRAAPHVRLMNHLWPALPKLRQDGADQVRGRIPHLTATVARRAYQPQRAVLIPVPKVDGGARPAALLTVEDRLVYDALVRHALRNAARGPTATTVFAPRGQHAHVAWTAFEAAVLDGSPAFVVVADIADFGAHVSQAAVAAALERAGCDAAASSAVRTFLAAVMDSDVGVPQGVPVSAMLAEAVLAGADRGIADAGWAAFRCSDDVRIPASTRTEGEAALADVGAIVASLGLRLNPAKSQVLPASDYRAAIGPTRTSARLWDALRGPFDGRIVDGRVGEGARWALGRARIRYGGRRVTTAFDDAPPEIRRRRRLDVSRALEAFAAARHPDALDVLPAVVAADPVVTPLAARYLRRVAPRAPDAASRTAASLLGAPDLLASQRAWIFRALVSIADHLDEAVRRAAEVAAAGPDWVDCVEAIRLITARGERPPLSPPAAVPAQFRDEFDLLLG